MKKRILSVLLTSALVLSMTACGGSTTSEAQPQTSDTNSTTSAVTSESTTSAAVTEDSTPEATTSAATTTAATTAEKPEEEEPRERVDRIYGITYAMNGRIMIYTSDGYYLYDPASGESTKVKDGPIAAIGDIGVYGSGSDKFSVFPLEGPHLPAKAIASADKGHMILVNKPYISVASAGEPLLLSSIPVAKIEESFSGNVLKFGLIGADGEWLYELSDKYSICNGSVIPIGSLTGGTTEYYSFGDSMLIVIDSDAYVYSFKNDTITHLGNTRSDIGVSQGTPKIVTITEDYVVLNLQKNIIKYHEKTGEIEELYKANGHQLTTYTYDSYVKISDGADPFMSVYNMDTSEKLDFDLSEYSVNHVIGATEDFIAFQMNNSSGTRYIVVMDKDGNMITEPIKLPEHVLYALTDGGVYETETKYLIGCDGESYIIDKATGKVKKEHFIFYDHNSRLADTNSRIAYNVDTEKQIIIYK